MKQLFLYISKAQAALNALNNERAGLLFRRLVNYVADETADTETGDPIVDALFPLFKVEIDEGCEKYESIVEKRREAGKRHRGNQYTRQNGTSVPNLEQMEQVGTNGTIYKNKNKNKNTPLINKGGEEEKKNQPPPPQKPVPLQGLEESVKAIMADRSYVEVLCMKNLLKPDELQDRAEAFIVDCKARGNETHADERDLKRHFDSWLTIHQEKQRQKENANNNDKSNVERLFGVDLSKGSYN